MLKNKNILVLSSITTYPVLSGGQARSHQIIKELARYNTVKVFIPIARKSDFPKFSSFEVNCGNYAEYRLINFFLQGITYILERFGLFGASFLLLKFILKTNRHLNNEINQADVIFLNFPHLSFLLEGKDKESYYISHNVEHDLIASNMKIRNHNIRNYFINKIQESEKTAIRLSRKTYACTQADITTYMSNLGFNHDKFIILENGVDKDKIVDIGPLPESYIGKNNKIVFVGSNFKPNHEAVSIIEDLAKVYKNLNFYIIGSVAIGKQSHGNILYDSNRSQTSINSYLKYADYAINPMISGGGSNLKMVDYFYFGIPVITTKIGLRGFEQYSDIILNEFDIESLKDIIFKIDNNRKAIVDKGLEIAKKYFWEDLVYNKIINEKK